MTKVREYVKFPNLSMGEGLKTGKNLVHVVVECSLTMDVVFYQKKYQKTKFNDGIKSYESRSKRLKYNRIISLVNNKKVCSFIISL